MSFDFFPDYVLLKMVQGRIVADKVVWSTREESYAIEVLTDIHVPVVADILGNSLLEQGSPQSLVGADLSEQEFSALSEGQVIVHKYRVWDS